MNAQDTRVSHCDPAMPEHYMQRLCELTNRDWSRYISRSKHALASKIGEIFRWSLRGILGELTARTQKYCLPFVRDGSFCNFTESDLLCVFSEAFGTDIIHSLIDISHNTKLHAWCGRHALA